jgi:hypothetical protein
MIADLDAQETGGRKRSGARGFTLDEKGLPERTASMLLRMLGLSAKEADGLARRPLPEIVLPDAAL